MSNTGGMGKEGSLKELSVEEMNKLRASLGLAPLATGGAATATAASTPGVVRTGPDEETFLDSSEKYREAERKAEEEREEDRERARKIQAKTKSLGERILEEEGGKDDDVQQWLAKSRERQAKAQENAKMDKDTAEALAKKIMADSMEPKKKRRRKGGDEDKDDGSEIGKNVRFAAHVEKLGSEMEAQEDVVLTLKDSRILDDDGNDVNDSDDVLESLEESAREVRAQRLADAKKTKASELYDDDEFEELRPGAKRSAGTANDPGAGTGVASEFYTSEEMAKLFKKKKGRKAAARHKRNTTADSVGEKSLEEMLLDGEGGSAAGGGGADGSDGKGVVAQPVKSKEEVEKETLDTLQQMTSVQRKMDKAIAKERRKALAMAHADDGLDEEDEELYQTLSRARAAAQQRQQQPTLEERVVQSLAVKQEPMEDDDGASRRRDNSSVVVDDMSAFLTKIEARRNEAIAEAQQQRKEEQKRAQEMLVEQDSMKAATIGDGAAAARGDDSEEDTPFEEQNLYSMSATHAQLGRMGGVEKAVKNSTVLVGRPQDGEFDLKDDPAPHLKLEYLDADGQQLRPKEAFRLMSYIFHGRKPHQKKLEKLARLKEEARRVAGMESTDTPLHAVATMERLQQETQQPYVVLTGKGAQNALLNLKKKE